MFKTQSSPRRFSAVLATAALVLSGIAGASAPAYASDTKKVTISGFAHNSVALTASMKQRIDRFIKANDEYTFVSCVGFADRAGTQARNKALGKGRAKAGCDQAVAASSEVEVVSSRGRWDRIRSGANVRRVEITLSKSATSASAGFTTYFEYMGAEQGIAEVKTLADGTLVLPTPTRPGYQFLGWFSDQYNGTKIGNGGDTYKPKRTRILWAQWFVPASGSSSASSSGSMSIAFSWGVDYSVFIDPTDTAYAMGLYCAENRPAVIKLEIDGNLQDVGPVTIPKCTNTEDPNDAMSQADIVPGQVSFSGPLPAITQGSNVTVIVEFTQTLSQDFFFGSFGGGAAGAWTYDDSQSFTKDIVFTDSNSLNGLIFNFSGGAA